MLAGWMKTYIVMPGMIFGVASSPLVDAGIQYSRSRGLPMSISPSVFRGQGGAIGKGLAVWDTVHVEDTADLFLLLWNAIVSHSDKAGHGWEGFYIVGNDVITFYDIAKETGRVLVERGLSTSDEVTTLSPEEIEKYYSHVRLLSFFVLVTVGDRGLCRGLTCTSALVLAVAVPTRMRLDGSLSTRTRISWPLSKMK